MASVTCRKNYMVSIVQMMNYPNVLFVRNINKYIFKIYILTLFRGGPRSLPSIFLLSGMCGLPSLRDVSRTDFALSSAASPWRKPLV
jgi:hypothetical protein